jgi:ubiquinone/menaquinone biosynthesis C-methylase UbiE
LCTHGELDVTLTIPRAPRNIQNLLSQKDLARDTEIRLAVHTCRRCGFVQLLPVLDDTYYDDYVMATTHSPQMQAYQQRQAAEFVSRFGLAGKKVIEVGCGDGNFLDHLKASGAEVYGIEPSSSFCKIALGRKHPVETGYVTADRVLAHGPFDGFATRQVLEHVPEIHSFLTGIRRNLHNGARGLVEVPSLEKALQDHRYFDFFTDHVNYFSLDTLRLALTLNGFEVLHVFHDMYDEYNVALVRAVSPPSLAGIQQASIDLAEDLRAFVQDHHIQGRKVAVWGAGGKGLSVLASAGIRDLDLLIDSDPHKQGRYTPVSHLLVQEPTPQNIQAMDAIIITAMAYRNEIEATLRSQYGFQGQIAVLGHRLEFAKDIV